MVGKYLLYCIRSYTPVDSRLAPSVAIIKGEDWERGYGMSPGMEKLLAKACLR